MSWIQIGWLQERVLNLEKLLERVCEINDLKIPCASCKHFKKLKTKEPCCDCDLKSSSNYERVKQEEL